MPLLLLAIAFATFVVGIVMFLRGRRGRQIDTHPLCAKCGYDLFGKPVDSHICPECGAIIASKFSVRIGNRQPRPRLIYGGLALSLLSVLLAWATITATTRGFNPAQYKPTWWLIKAAAAENDATGWNNRRELLSRLLSGNVSPGDQAKIVAAAMSLQADRSKPWNPLWGDMIQYLQNKGQLPAPDWQKYLAQSEIVTLNVRPNVARGDMIPLHLNVEIRAAMPAGAPKAGSAPRPTASLPGITSYFSWGGSCGIGLDLNGFLTVLPADWDKLQPGPQIVNIAVQNPGLWDAANPTTLPSINLQGHWTLLPASQPSVTLYRDEALAAQAQQSISYALTPATQGADTILMLGLTTGNSPVDLSVDVMVRYGPTQWDGGNLLFRKYPLNHNNIFLPKDVIGQRGDIILRPSISAAANTVEMTTILDHEFIFKDVLFEATK